MVGIRVSPATWDVTETHKIRAATYMGRIAAHDATIEIGPPPLTDGRQRAPLFRGVHPSAPVHGKEWLVLVGLSVSQECAADPHARNGCSSDLSPTAKS